jgi:glycolate oxidase
MTDVLEQLRKVVGDTNVLSGSQVHADYTHDEAMTATPVAPLAVVFPASTDDVAEILRVASQRRVPVVTRGSGTGLSGGCQPVPDGILIAFDHMRAIREIDPENQVAVVEPGVTLEELDQALAPFGLIYPVSPGEQGASLGGNVATNAGGMRAVRYGVTRHHVLGLEVVLADGTVMRTGGKFVKCSSGYDLTQLLIGSEGTLAVTTEVTLKVEPRRTEVATVLAPFATLAAVAHAVPPIVASGVDPSILEYIDVLAMAGITANVGLDLGIPDEVRAATLAYLVVVLEGTDAVRVEEDTETLATLLAAMGALEVFVLPSGAGAQLISAREKAFFASKAAGADDIVDAVVPRAGIPAYLARVAELADRHGALITGCGHVGDGNVHLSVFLPAPDRRAALLHEIFETAIAGGGAISGEHGIGTAKLSYFLETQDAVNLDLMRSIKRVFDPLGILGPDRLLGITADSGSAP